MSVIESVTKNKFRYADLNAVIRLSLSGIDKLVNAQTKRMRNKERSKARLEGCHIEYSDGNTRGYVFEVSVIVYCRRIRVILQETPILKTQDKIQNGRLRPYTGEHASFRQS